MGSINDEITRINDAKTAINAAITECGVQMPAPEDATIDTYAGKIREIPTAVLSQLNMVSVGGPDSYIKQLSQTNGVITATTGSIASTSSSGLTPQLSAEDGQFGDGYVLCYGSQDTKPKWKQLVLPFASYSDFLGFVAYAESTFSTKLYVDLKIAALVDSAPENLNTLKELADALESNENMSTSILELIASKLDMYAQSFEMNKTGLGGGHGGFIDFHYHNKNQKPTNVNGTVVTVTPDYTSRIIEDDPGKLKINGVIFKNKVVTATSYKILGTANSTATITSDNATNMLVDIGGNIPLVIKYDDTDKFVAPGSSFSNLVNLGTSSRIWKEVHATTFKGTLVNTTIGTWIKAAKNPAVNITNVTDGSAGSVFTTPLKDGYITVLSYLRDNTLRFNYFTTDKYTNSTNTPFASLHIEADTGNVIATTFTGNLIGTSSDTEGLKSLGKTTLLTGTNAPAFVGLTMKEYYNLENGPAKFGNLIQMKGKDAAGCSELFCEWTSTSVSGKLHYRSKRDMSNPWGAWKTMIDSDGGSIYKSLLIYNDSVNYAQILFINTRAKEDGGGWASTVINLKDNVGTTLALFGMNGTNGALTYLYLGTGAYNANNNLRIYSDKVSFGNITQYETFQQISTTGASGNMFNNNYLDPYANKALIIGPNALGANSLLINRAGIQSWNTTTSDTHGTTIPDLYLQGAGGNIFIGGGVHPLNNNDLAALGNEDYRWQTLNGYNIGCDNNNVFISATFPSFSSSDIKSIDSTVTSETPEKYFKALCRYVFSKYKGSSTTNGAITLVGLARPASTGTLIISLYTAINSLWTSLENMPQHCSAVYTSLEGALFHFGSASDGQWYYRRTIPGYLLSLNITTYAHTLSYYSGATSVGNSPGNAKEKSNTYLFFSYPTGATAISDGLANIMSLRMLWSTSYLHEIFASPNKRQLWHRWISGNTPKPWSRIVLEDNESESLKYNISISGNADTATSATSATLVGMLGINSNSSYPLIFTSRVNPNTSNRSNRPLYTNTTANLTYNPNQGSVNASGGFFETSDERLKNLLNDVNVDFEKLKQIPKKYFTWKEDGSITHIGTSAQALQKIYPELVNSDQNGILSVAYDKLSIIALKGIDVLYDLVLDLKSEIKELKCKLNEHYVG